MGRTEAFLDECWTQLGYLPISQVDRAMLFNQAGKLSECTSTIVTTIPSFAETNEVESSHAPSG